MAPSFFQKLGFRTKSKRRVLDPRYIWIRPGVEVLDQRILPSVSATLSGGILSVVADTSGGTSEVKLIHNQDQVEVDDGQQLVNTFGIDQIQQIQFQYNTQDQHQYNLNLPIGQNQITLTNLPVGEADLTLGDTSLTASINAALPDGTAITLAGSVDNQGNYDVSGTADVTVGGFALQGAAFEVTNSSVAVMATAMVGGDSVSLAGTLDGQGNYDLTGNADISVDGFTLSGASFELTNTSLAAAATMTIGTDSVSLSGSVDNQGNYDLTGTADVTVDGFTLSGASFDLTNTSLAASATVAVGSDSVSLAGMVDNQGNYDLTGAADVTVDGFTLSGASFELTNSSFTASSSVAVGSDTVSLSGSVDNQGNYDLTGAADVTVDGFALSGASFELTNSSFTASATVTLGSDTVSLSGSVDDQGNYDLMGTADITVDGFALSGASFELTNTSLTASAMVTLGSDTINLSGSVDSDGNYDLMGTADITVDGFALSGASFELTNSNFTASAMVTLGSDTINLSGSVDDQGNYDLMGTADITVDGFAISGASFELTNTSLTASATITVGSDTVSLSGSVDSDGNYDLMGTADITVAGFTLSGTSFELTNTTLTATATLSLGSDSLTLSGSVTSDGSYDLTGTADITIAGFALPATSFELTSSPGLTNGGLTVSATLPLGDNTISLSGSVDADGNYDLMGTADITVGGFALPGASFELTNTSLTVSVTITVGSDTISLSGSLDNQGNYDLTGMADITVGGFALPGATFELTNTSLTVAATLSVGSDSVSLSGSVDSDGNYDLTGTADITVGGFALPGASFELTNTSLTVSATLTLGSNSVNLSGTVDSDGNYDLTGSADITVATIPLSASFELTNTSLTVSSSVSILGNTVSLSGTVDSDGNYDLTGTGTITVAGFNLNTNFELTNTSLTVSTTLAVGTAGSVTLSGTYANGQLGDLTGDGTLTIAGLNLMVHATYHASTLTFSAMVSLNGLGSVTLSGTYAQGQPLSLTGTGTITVAGFNLNATVTVGTGITVTTSLTVGSAGSISLSGSYANGQLGDLSGMGTLTIAGLNLTVNATYHASALTFNSTVSLGSLGNINLSGTYASGQPLSLTGMGMITVAGFNLNATVTVNTAIVVTTMLAVGTLGSITLSGNYANGQLGDLSGTGTLTIAGLNLTVSATYHAGTLTFTSTVSLGGLGNVNLSGTYASGQPLSLTGTGTITVAGFNLNATVTVNTAITVSATLAVGTLGSISLSGTYANGQLGDLSGTGTLTVAGLSLMVHATYHANTLTFTGTVSLGSLGNINLSGTYASGQPLSLTGTGTITVAGFNLNATVTVNTAITVSAMLAVGTVGSVSLSGTFSNGQLGDLSGTGTLTIVGLNLTVNATYHASTLTFTSTVSLGSLGNINLSGTYASGQPLSLTGTGTITVAGFNLNATVTVNTAITVSATLAVGTLGSISLSGTYANGQLGDLSGTGTLTIAGLSLMVHATYHASTLTFTGTVSLGSLGNINLSGTYASGQPLSLTGTGTITVAGFSLNATVTVNTAITVSTTLAVGTLGSISLSGTFSNGQLGDLSGTGTLTVAGLNLMVHATYHASTLTFTGTVSLGSLGNISLSGTYASGQPLSLTGTGTITVAGFSLNATVTVATAITVSASLAVGTLGSISLSGTFSNGQLGDLSGTGTLTVGGFNLNVTGTYHNSTLTITGSVSLGTLGNVSLTGTYSKTQPLSLTGTGTITVAGFSLHATVTLGTNLTVGASLAVGTLGSVSLSGTFSNGQLGDLTGTGTLNIAGFTLTVNGTYHNSTLTFSTTVSIGGVNVNLSGTYSSTTSLSLTGSAAFTIAGFSLTPSFTLTTSSLTVAVGVAIPSVGTLNFSGTVDSHGNFALNATTHIVIAGFGLDATFHLTNTSLTVSATVNLPIVGNVNLSGTVDSHGNYSLSAGVSNISILFVTLTNASVTLTNSSLTVNATATGLPLIGTVQFVGTITGSSYTFTATLPSVNVLGATLKNLHVTLTSGSLSVGGHMDGIPLVGSADFNGTITSSGFSLSASVSNVTIIGFHFSTIALTLTQQSLSLSTTVSLPIVGTVTFAGTISFSGSFSISATAPHFTLLGFIGVDNASVAISFPNPTLTVSAHINLLNIGMVTFTGSIGAGGTFSFDGSASLNIAGFSLGTARMHMGNMPGDPSDGIHIGPFTTPALPLIGAVTIEGSYASGGRFSFLVTLHVPIAVGPILVDTETFGLSNDSLTLGIGVGYNLAGFLDLTGYGQVTVYAPDSQHNLGDFDLLATVNVSVVGFQAAGARMELKNTKGQFSFTTDVNLNLIIATAMFHGEIDFNKGLVGFAGRANIGVAGFTLSNSTFLITNAQVQGDAVNGYTFPHDAQGHLISGNGIHIEVHSHTNLNLQPVINVAVNFDGVFAKQGTGYTIDVKGNASLTIAGFNVASATLEIDNTHMSATFHYAYPGIFSADFAGTITYTGNFDFSATATIGLAGFGATGHLHLYKMGSNAGLDLSATINVQVAQVAFSGYLHSDGSFQLTGSANVGLAGFSVANASFTLNNGGVSFAVNVNVFVATVHFSGSVDTHGNFRLTGSANVGLAGFNVATASFTLSNSGVSFSASINVYVATVSFSGSVDNHGNFRLTGSAGVRLAGFSLATASFTLTNTGVTFGFTLNVFVATVNFSGSVDIHGNFRLTGSASVGFAGFGSIGTGSFTLTNSGLTVSASVNVIVANINVTGSVSNTGAFSFTVNIHMGFAGFGASGSLTLNNSGVRVSATLDLHFLGIGVSFNGVVNSNGSFSFSIHAGLNWPVISASVDFTLSNHGFSATLHAGFDLTAGVSWWIFSLRVGFRASVDIGFGINTNGTFSASGSVNACAYLGLGICVGVGFHVNNHQFCFNTSGIGFSIWGIGFHPFGDLCVNY